MEYLERRKTPAREHEPDLEIAPLRVAFEKMFNEPISISVDGETYEIDADAFNLTFCFDDTLFEIRNIDTRGTAGVGNRVLSAPRR